MSLLIALGLATTTTLAQYPAQPDEVRLHIDSDSPTLELYRVTADGVGTVSTYSGTAAVGIVQFQRECFAPCDMTLSEPHQDFFVAGNGITPSARFSLLGKGEDITLRVKPGSTFMRGVGWTSTTLGLTALAVAGSLFLVDSLMADSGVPTLGGTTNKGAGGKLALLGGGVVMLGGGITLLAFSGTDVEVLPSPGPATPREML